MFSPNLAGKKNQKKSGVLQKATENYFKTETRAILPSGIH